MSTKITQQTNMKDYLTADTEIRICQDKKGYWLFDNQWLKETDLKESDPTSEWTQGIKPLKKGENTFESNFHNSYYLMKMNINNESLVVGLYQSDWKGIINKETFKLFRHKSFAKSEKGAIITPQMFDWLKDFGLIRIKK